MNKQTQTNKPINNGWTNSPNQESTQLWMKKKQPQPLMYSSMDGKSIIPTYKEVNYGWTNNQAQLMKRSMVDEYEQAQLSNKSLNCRWKNKQAELTKKALNGGWKNNQAPTT